MPTTDRKLRVFLCHASQDKPVVRELYQRLLAEGWIDPWLDEEKLLPGQDWDLEIEKAVEATDAVIVCLSNNSVTKEGYVQKELRGVVDKAEEKPEGTIFIFPARLDNCLIPHKIKNWQYTDYFPADARPDAFERLLKSLEARALSLDIYYDKSLAHEKFTPAGHQIFLFGKSEFVKVSAGEFLMGSNDDDKYADDNEKPQHKFNISYDYWVGRFPVTNSQFAFFSKRTGRAFDFPAGANLYPVWMVRWHDSQEYIHWLNLNYYMDLPKGYMFRLPSEAEWEKAARGTNGQIYPWGNEFNSNNCNSIMSDKKPTPIGTYSPRGDSPYGAADMAGNVWEWTRSIFSFYPYKTRYEDEKVGGDGYVLRGGACNCSQEKLRTAYRNYESSYYVAIGFRVAIVPNLMIK